MLRRLPVCLFSLLATAIVLQGADAPESLWRAGHETVAASARSRRVRRRPPQRDPNAGPVIEQPRVIKTSPERPQGEPVGRTELAPLLDKLLVLLNLELGAHPWFTGAAVNPGGDQFFLTFMPPSKDGVVVEPLDVNRLRGNGQVVTLDEATLYRIKLQVNIFNPVRGSTIHLTPEKPTQGSSHRLGTGQLLDLIKNNSYVFRAKGKEFWFLYGTDIDAQNRRFAETKSLGFFAERGMNSKMWTLPEAQLPSEQAVDVALGDTVIRLFKTQEGELLIFEAPPPAALASLRP
ncbi:MAG: hypothetical protein HYT79_03845 [Elusimicrobia bacterium]|nr:hypothetical protein [Elusimicrobiota bacterium]